MVANVRTAGQNSQPASVRRDAPAAAKTQPRKAPSGKTKTSQPVLTVSRPELLVGGSDADFRRLVHGLFSFLSRHEAIRAGHARQIGLAGIEYTALISIAHLGTGGNVSVSAVAQHLRVTGAFITNVCQRLLALGLIDKRTDASDRRRVLLTITGEGRRRLEALAPVQRQVNDVEFGCLSKTEFAQLLDLVERLVDSGERAVALQRYLAAGEVPRNSRSGG